MDTKQRLPKICFGGVSHSGPISIYRLATPEPAVSLATFCSRLRRLVIAGAATEANIEEALRLASDDYRLKYGVRKTFVELAGRKIDLQEYFATHSESGQVEYRNFWQRVRALQKKTALDSVSLQHAAELDAAAWQIFYGGGRHKSFIYSGDEYPEHTGKHFHSISAFLHTIGSYKDRALVWSRLKAGWNLDDALTIPVAFAGQRSGSIYCITRRKTGAIYVGLTVTTVEQRWAIHVRRALAGATTKIGRAIREDGSENFSIETLETGIDDPDLLRKREAFWVNQLDALGKAGLNSAKPGGMGSPRGKQVQYEGETFRSIEEASDVLGVRLGIERHVVRTRLQEGLRLPKANEVRRHSKHPDAGSKLFRCWLGILKRHAGNVTTEWASSYDQFKADVSPTQTGLKLVRKCTKEPWGPENFEWVDSKAKVERTHGKPVSVHGVVYPSLQSIANAYKIGISTLKNRITRQGMTLEEAVVTPIGSTSYKQDLEPIVVDGKTFRSARQAILYIAETRGITEGQAKYRFGTGNL